VIIRLFFLYELRYYDIGQQWSRPEEGPFRGEQIVFYAFYAVAIVILVLHFTGWLKRNNLEWLMLVLAVAVFPAVIFLK
jgi:hypothetical protein